MTLMIWLGLVAICESYILLDATRGVRRMCRFARLTSYHTSARVFSLTRASHTRTITQFDCEKVRDTHST